MTAKNETGPQTLEQRRANHAWKSVLSFNQNKDADAKRVYGNDAEEYANEAKKLPMRIIAAGLGPALAFLLAKAQQKKKNLRQLHDHLTDWVIRQRPIPAKVEMSLLESVVADDANFLRRATDEALAYLVWLNRFADAEGLRKGDT